MNYWRPYERLIERARFRILEGYTERHHVVPKCLGGSNKKENLVRLTPEEHFLAHQLLIKFYPRSKGLIFATHAMANVSKVDKVHNKEYGWLKRRRAEVLSETWRGVNNPGYGKPGTILGRKHTQEAKDKVSASSKGKKRTDEHKRRISAFHTGKIVSDITRQKFRRPKPKGFGDNMRGAKNHRFGLEHTDETRAKLRTRWVQRKVDCPPNRNPNGTFAKQETCCG